MTKSTQKYLLYTAAVFVILGLLYFLCGPWYLAWGIALSFTIGWHI